MRGPSSHLTWNDPPAYVSTLITPSGFEIGPIRLSETCQNVSGQVKCLVIRRSSIFFDSNLKLGLLMSRRDHWQCGTSHADTDENDVSLAGVLQDAVGRVVCCVFAPFLGDNTRFFSVGTLCVKSASVTGRSFCRSSNRLLDSVLVMFLRARRWPVGACAFHIQPEK